MRLTEQFERGLDAPICLTWELTYACNLACVHCLSSSGRRDPRELSTAECKSVIDELQRMQVFYVNVGGGEPTVRPDFWELLDYAIGHDVGVKFSTNGVRLGKPEARRLAGHRLRRRADQPRRCRRGDQRRRARRRLLRHGAAGRSTTWRPRASRTRRSAWSSPGTTSASSTSSRRWPTPTARRCASPGCGPPAAAPTPGTSCTRPRSSSATSTSGCSPPARRS